MQMTTPHATIILYLVAFCGIPKVSITQWLQFLRFTFGAKDYQVNRCDVNSYSYFIAAALISTVQFTGISTRKA